jgi:drug/metabolite transporter (DMT)-like permease
VVIGRSLAEDGFQAPTVLGIRFTSAGLLVLALLVLLHRPLLPVRGERLGAFLLGAVGYAIESTLFFSGLQRGTAAAVTLLFYAYPSVVALIELARGRRPHPGLLAAIALSAAGTAVVVGAGEEVTISTSGALFSLGAAGSFAIYLLVSHRVMKQTDGLTTAAWVATGAGLSLLTRAVLLGDLQSPGSHLPVMVLNGLATAAAFSLMFAALRRLGPSPTAVVMTLEAVSAIVLSAIFLDETLGALQLVGGAAILVATVLVGLTHEPAVEAPPPT